jgi:hypothetical protein
MPIDGLVRRDHIGQYSDAVMAYVAPAAAASLSPMKNCRPAWRDGRLEMRRLRAVAALAYTGWLCSGGGGVFGFPLRWRSIWAESGCDHAGC